MNVQPAFPGLARTLLRARQRSSPSPSSPFFTSRARPYHYHPSDRPDRIEYNSTGLRLACSTSSQSASRVNIDSSLSERIRSTRGYATDRPRVDDANKARRAGLTSSHGGEPDVHSRTPASKTDTNSNSRTTEDPVIQDTLSDGEPYLPPLPHAQTNYAPFIRRLLSRLPHPSKTPNPDPGSHSGSYGHGHDHGPHPHFRPTKDQLLAATTSFWQRLRIRWKWFSIRSWRRFNIDDWTAFGSWVLVGNSQWLLETKKPAARK